MAADQDAFAELADLVLNVGRLIRARTPTGVIPMNDTERQVMRLVDLDPGCSPGDIAARGRLQRTNVSTALRTLEEKGMVERTSDGGRGVIVRPTRRADENLAVLRAAWGAELRDVLDESPADVRRCTDLLARIEAALTAADV
ncbi:MarR family winged helix-turn-helix transcriptional regulator [Jatrophihabitans fulvus]